MQNKTIIAIYTWDAIERLNGRIKQAIELKFNIIKDTGYTDFDGQGNIANVREAFGDQSREYVYKTYF